VSRGIADSSLFIERESGRPLRIEDLPDQLAISVVTIGELRAAVLDASDVASRDRRLATLAAALDVEPLPVDGAVATAWARLRAQLHECGLSMPVNDSWIAATALALGVPVVTQDGDFDGVPGLDVIRV